VAEVGAQTGLVGPGVVAGRSLVTKNSGLVRRFVQATLHGLHDAISSPSAAFAAARAVRGLSNLQGSAVGDQRAVLLRSIAFWHSAATRTHGLGYADPAQWQRSIKTLRTIGQITVQPKVQTVMTNRFAAGAAKL
jgi:NitT/TauT family transport system substrate-binding protein